MSTTNGRDAIWAQIKTPWDVLIIGGGIVGAGLLREAARMGIRALLVDAADFSSGTSSRSSKMVHGGLRYLRNGQVILTMESVRERQRLLHEGNGLIDPMEFLLVSYQDDRPPAWVFGLGLVIYDTLAFKWKHKRHTALEIQQLCPPINPKRMVGGFQFSDAQTDDARLVLRILQEAQRAGGTALNYARVEGLLRNRSGRVCGVQLHDRIGGREEEIQAGVVINAGGAWADNLRALAGKKSRLRLLRGSHLLFPLEKLPLKEAISFLHPADKRPVFAFPWEGVTLVGTTDVDHGGPAETDPRISEYEVDYLMAAVNHIFGDVELKKSDVRSTLAGIRSVLDTGRTDPSRESRDQVLWDEDGLVTITGGKLTMFHHMALATLRFIRRRLPLRSGTKPERHALDPVQKNLLGELASDYSLEHSLALRLLGRYGTDAPALLQVARSGELEPVGETPTLWAELRWAAHSGSVVHLEDLLLRRIRLGLLLPNGGAGSLARIRQVCQLELGWDDSRWRLEELAYQDLWQRAYGPPPA